MVYSVQYLRFFAAIAVVIVHAAGEVGLVFQQGQVGVDLFFIISGFVIYLVTERSRNSPKVFLYKRFIRVALPYYAILFFVIFDYTTLGWNNYDFGKLTVSNTLHSFLFIFETSDEGVFVQPIYPIGWTLNFEIFFYVLFAVAMMVSQKHRLALTASAIFGLTILQWFGRFEGGMWYMVQTRTAIEFIFGMLVAFYYINHLDKLRQHRATVPVAMVACLIGFSLLALGPPVHPFSGTRFITAGIPSAVFLCAVVTLESCGQISKSKILFYLGGASYSLYLVHLAVAKSVVHFIPINAWPGPIFAVIMIVVASILVSLAFHHLCERPLLELSHRLGQRHLKGMKLQGTGS